MACARRRRIRSTTICSRFSRLRARLGNEKNRVLVWWDDDTAISRGLRRRANLWRVGSDTDRYRADQELRCRIRSATVPPRRKGGGWIDIQRSGGERVAHRCADDADYWSKATSSRRAGSSAQGLTNSVGRDPCDQAMSFVFKVRYSKCVHRSPDRIKD